MGRQEKVRLPRHRAGRDVDDDRDALLLVAGVAEGGERIGGLAGLADEEGEAARLQHRLAVAKLGSDIDIYRHAGELLEPIFGNHAGVEAGAAGDDGDAVDVGEVKVAGWQRDLALERADIALERLGNHDRLLENLLLHIVAIIALLDWSGRRPAVDNLALDGAIIAIMNLDAVAAYDDPVAFLQIDDAPRPGRQRNRVRAEVILAFAIADGERRSHARADDQIRIVAEQESDGEGAVQAWQDRGDGIFGARSALNFAGDEMRDHFAVSLAEEGSAVGDQLVAQWLEILDDAIVDQRYRPGDVRMGVADGRRTVRRPARMGDADVATEGIGLQLGCEIIQLALGAAAVELAAVDGADAGAVIAAIFEALQPIEQPLRDGGFSDNSDNSAHWMMAWLKGVGDADTRHAGRKIPDVTGDEDRAVDLRSG